MTGLKQLKLQIQAQESLKSQNGLSQMGIDQLKGMQYALKLVEKDEQRHRRIYRWLLDYADFPAKPEGGGNWYWRSNLRTKLKNIGIEFKK